MLSRSAAIRAFMVLVFVLATGLAFAGPLDHTVYGKLHVSLNGFTNSEEYGTSLTSNATYLGLAGSYRIREGFAVIGQLEVQVNTARQEYSLGTARNSYVGLRGTYGTFLAGIHDTPLKTLGRKMTYFEDTIGDFRSTTMQVDRRLDEILIYELPALKSGLGGQVSYRLDQSDWTDPEAEHASAFSAMLFFAPDDFLLGFAYQSTAAGYFNPEPEETGAESVFRGVGQFETESFGVSALFQGIDGFGGVENLFAVTFGFEGMVMPSPRWRFKGSYYSTDPNTDLDDDRYTQLALGIDHPLDAVTFYLQYAVMMNDDNRKAGLGNNDWGDVVLPSDLGKSASGISLGLWWIF